MPMAPAVIVDTVLRAYAEWGRGQDVGGEWKDIRGVPRATLYDALARGDRGMLATILCDPIGRKEWSGLFSHISAQDDHAAWMRITGETDDAILCYDGMFYPDAPRHDGEAYRLIASGARLIIDIGGGYGGLALQLHRRAPLTRYVDIDLADTLYLAYGFLAAHCEAGTVALGYDPLARLSLVPSHAVPLAVRRLRPDVVTNYRSFGEMSYTAVSEYFAMIAEWRPPRVVHENASGFPRPDDVDAAAFAYPELLTVQYPPLRGYVIRHGELAPWHAARGRYSRYELRRVIP